MASKRLIPPKNGATVRFYRIGHGDCFLIAFAGQKPSEPVYVLIDCGYKPGSHEKIEPPTDPAAVVASIAEATDSHIDVAVVTHEHEDHLNAITADNFADFTIGQTWLAWTEDPKDRIANKLREEYEDKLYALVAARHRLASMGATEVSARIDAFLELELPFDATTDVLPAADALFGAMDFGFKKKALKLLRDRAQGGVKTLLPHDEVLTVPGAKDVRVYTLGPPRGRDAETTETVWKRMDPKGKQAYPGLAFDPGCPGRYFAAAAAASPSTPGLSPFAARYSVRLDQVSADARHGTFFSHHYGHVKDGRLAFNAALVAAARAHAPDEVRDDADWRRIDTDWLMAAEHLAIDVVRLINNTSLVLAFELGKGGKVLLFAADAQLGNWLSWADGSWTNDEGDEITVRDLLARTVLYKVGHHGSHNGTLAGGRDDEWPNLQWMATRSAHAGEFTAMITAVRAWAETKVGWDHPLQSIKEALLDKAAGRVFQTDTALDDMEMADGTPAADWERFRSRASGGTLFFDLKIER